MKKRNNKIRQTVESNLSEAILIDEAAQAASATMQPAFIDNMWMSAFLNNDEGIIAKPKKATIKAKQQKLVSAIKKLPKITMSEEKMRDRFKPYLDEMVRHDKKEKNKLIFEVDTFPKFQSSHLEKLFEIQHLENMAAKKIQRCWLYSKYIHFLRYTCVAVRMIVRIQKMIRGYLCRKNAAVYYTSKTILTIRLQAVIRGFLSNCKWRLQIFQERRAAKIIQRCVQKKITYARNLLEKKHASAIKIQSLWRGLVARAVPDILWMNQYVIKIQTLMRKYLSIKKVNHRRVVLITAADRIIAAYRIYYSTKHLSKLLIEREQRYRTDTIAALTAEENHADEQLTKLATRFLKLSYRENQRQHEKYIKSTFNSIDNKEHDYVELIRQRDVLTPLNIQQGWTKDIDINRELLRQEIVNMKEAYLFSSLKSFEETFYDSYRHAQHILELVDRVTSLQLWKTQVSACVCECVVSE